MTKTAIRTQLAHDVARILNEVQGRAVPGLPALVVLAGLPGTGKTAVARGLRERTGAVVLESDALRKLLFGRPAYSAAESERLFAAIHAAIDELLARRVSVILDATNVEEYQREPLYRIAERHGAKLLLVHVTAPTAVARERLTRRRAAREGSSDADLGVYEQMRGRSEAIARPHRVLDTSNDIEAALGALAKEMMQP